MNQTVDVNAIKIKRKLREFKMLWTFIRSLHTRLSRLFCISTLKYFRGVTKVFRRWWWEIYRFVQETELKSKLRELYSKYDAGWTGYRPFFLSFFYASIFPYILHLQLLSFCVYNKVSLIRVLGLQTYSHEKLRLIQGQLIFGVFTFSHDFLSTRFQHGCDINPCINK